MTDETPKARHRHCSECGQDFEGTRALCTDCILKEHDEIDAASREHGDGGGNDGDINEEAAKKEAPPPPHQHQHAHEEASA